MRRLLRDESGFTLALSLAVMLVLSLTAAAVLTATAVNHRSSLKSSEAEKAFALAQQGLAYAEGRLYTAPQTAASVLVPGTDITPRDDIGSIHYSGTLCDATTTPSCSPKVWTLYGTGTVDGVSRTVSAQVTIPQVTSTTTYTTTNPVVTSNFTIWNYVYVDGSGGGCTTIGGNVTINVPFYTNGSLCLQGSVNFTGSDLEVAGSLTVSGSAKIGSSAARIGRMNVVGACTPAPCDGSHSPIWVNVPGVGHTLTPPNVVKPAVDLPTTYSTSNPGPLHPCQAGSGVPANFFDNDGTLNDSDGNINLFPSGQPYDCHVGSNELKWDGAGNLLVNGAFYFDGNLALSTQHVVYSGLGTLFFTGTMTLNGNGNLCGVSGCTSAGWHPDTNALVLVAGCQNATGGSITTGCVTLNGGFKSQVGVYSNTDYNISGNAVNMGPVITSTASFLGTVGLMLPFHNPPTSAPANTTTTQVATTTTMTTTSDGAPGPAQGWSG